MHSRRVQVDYESLPSPIETNIEALMLPFERTATSTTLSWVSKSNLQEWVLVFQFSELLVMIIVVVRLIIGSQSTFVNQTSRNLLVLGRENENMIPV